MITLKDVQIARERIAPYILHTPTIRVPALDDIAGCQVYLKLDCTQITGSFKLRGALNCMLALSDEERARGVTAPSSGNHAQALAYARIRKLDNDLGRNNRQRNVLAAVAQNRRKL